MLTLKLIFVLEAEIPTKAEMHPLTVVEPASSGQPLAAGLAWSVQLPPEGPAWRGKLPGQA